MRILCLTLVLLWSKSVSITKSSASHRHSYPTGHGDIFEESNDLRAIPVQQNDSQPVKVMVGVYVESIGNFVAQKMTYDMDIFFRLSWQDRRLTSKNTLHKGLSAVISDEATFRKIFWSPDLYFGNAVKADFQKVIKPNMAFYIESNGTVAYSTRVTMTLSCSLNLHDYPFDTQACYVRIASYAHTVREMQVEWFPQEALVYNPDIFLAEFNIVKMEPAYCTKAYNYSVTEFGYKTEKFSCLLAKVYLKRSSGFHLVQSYIPTALIVMISWLSFWIERGAVPARVTLAFTTILSLTTQGTAIRVGLPMVSYAKAIDYWYAVCMIFVIAGMIEFAAVNNYMQKAKRFERLVAGTAVTAERRALSLKRVVSDEESSSIDPNDIEDALLKGKKETFAKRKFTELAEQSSKRSLLIDQWSRILFPTVFAIFVVIYTVVFALLPAQAGE